MADQFVQYPVNSATIAPSTIYYTRNGSLQPVTQDTVTPSNNRPLVVSLLDTLGNINTVASTQSGAWNITNITGTVSLPTGAATQATLAAIAGQLPSTLGQKVSAGSLAVVLASDQGAVSTNATQAGTWNITNITGTVSLPTGAATAANQATEITSLASIATNSGNTQGSATGGTAASKSDLAGGVFNTVLPTLTTGQQASMQLDSSGRQIMAPIQAGSNNIGSITNVTGTVSLPTGAATSALQTALNAQIPATLGTKVSASSLAVVLASDQAAISTKESGSAGVANTPVYNLYTTTSITTAAYVQLVASTSNAINLIDIFDSSGQAMILATGAAASEVPVYYVPPGGGSVRIAIASGVRLSMKALTANATSGYLLVNMLK